MTPSIPWGYQRGRFPLLRHHLVGRRQARRLSRRCARIDATTSPERLRAMLTGSSVARAAVTDFTFAAIATRFRHDQFQARVRRMKRRGARSLLFVGMVLVTLNFLFCMAYALFRLTLEAAPL